MPVGKCRDVMVQMPEVPTPAASAPVMQWQADPITASLTVSVFGYLHQTSMPTEGRECGLICSRGAFEWNGVLIIIIQNICSSDRAGATCRWPWVAPDRRSQFPLIAPRASCVEIPGGAYRAGPSTKRGLGFADAPSANIGHDSARRDRSKSLSFKTIDMRA